MASSRAISASDPQAVEKLNARLQECREYQDMAKGVNAYWRRTGTCVGAPGITNGMAESLDNKIANATVSWERVPVADYLLKNNYAEMRRLEKRIAEISRNHEVGFSGWAFAGGRAAANADLNRLQLFFEEKPNEQQRSLLKSNGFKWAPSQDAWQRQLNDNAIYAAGRIGFIKPSDGRSVREHQPKPPAKDAVAR